MSEHNWHVTVWCPAGNALVGEVAGIMDEAGYQQAVILGRSDGVSEEDIKRAQFIVRACNSHDDLLAALEASVAEHEHNDWCKSCELARDAIKKALPA
jgi:hypothetical protein